MLESDPGGKMVRILTLNINYDMDKHGPWEQRRGLIRDAILEKQPDIVALQAVRQSGELSQAEELAHLLEYPSVIFQPVVELEERSIGGSGFISCHPVISFDHLPLSVIPGQEDSNPRILLNALFELPNEKLRVFNAHFSWVEVQATRNLDEAFTYIKNFPEPSLLVGDFNIQPNSDLLARLRMDGWFDAWEKLYPSKFFPDKTGYTFEAHLPTMRIDYVWAAQELADRVTIAETVAAPYNGRGTALSDHLGLVVSFSD
jgi:endonuclease/exonuclease/phosphatase family metal-dependent hydrolase